jgi:hypothetical protein
MPDTNKQDYPAEAERHTTSGFNQSDEARASADLLTFKVGSSEVRIGTFEIG